MDDLLPLLLARNDGVVNARELAGAGLDGHGIRAAVRRHELVRVRSGAFVGGDAWSAADVVGRHVLTTRAMARRLDRYAVSHVSADLGPVHMCPVGSGQSRSAGPLRVHPAVGVDDVVHRHGVAVVRVEVAVLQTAEGSFAPVWSPPTQL